jgi:hypothetical protein
LGVGIEPAVRVSGKATPPAGCDWVGEVAARLKLSYKVRIPDWLGFGLLKMEVGLSLVPVPTPPYKPPGGRSSWKYS